MNQITIETQHGQAVIHIHQGQYNCFLPPAGGAGVFAKMPEGLPDSQCRDIFRELLELGPHKPDIDLSDKASHQVTAGTAGNDQIISMAVERARQLMQ